MGRLYQTEDPAQDGTEAIPIPDPDPTETHLLTVQCLL